MTGGVVLHSLEGTLLCGRRCRVSVPLDISKDKLQTKACLPTVVAFTIKNLLHVVHTMAQNSPAVGTQARSRAKGKAGTAAEVLDVCTLKGPSRRFAER